MLIHCIDCKQQYKQGDEENHSQICFISCDYCIEQYPACVFKDHVEVCLIKKDFEKIQVKFENEEDDQKLDKIHKSVNELQDYIIEKVNKKIAKGYIFFEKLKNKTQQDFSDNEDQDFEGAMLSESLSYISQRKIKKSSIQQQRIKVQQIPEININVIQQNENQQKQNQDQLGVLDISSSDEDDNFIQDLKIEEDTSEWALLVTLYALLKIEKKDYVTKYEIQDQIKILKFSFDIAIKRQSVYQTLRTQKQLISEITDDLMDETFYCLTEIGKNIARNLYKNKLKEIKNENNNNYIRSQQSRDIKPQKNVKRKSHENKEYKINVNVVPNASNFFQANNLQIPGQIDIYKNNSQMSLRDLTDLSVQYSSLQGSRRNSIDSNDDQYSQVSQYNGELGRNCSAPFNVLLADKWNESYDPENYYMSEKLDGVRGVWTGKKLFSRNQKQFFPPKWFTKDWPNCQLDGELWTKRHDFQKCVSYVKKHVPIDSEWEQVKFIVFDIPGLNKPFHQRYKKMAEEIPKLNNPYIVCHTNMKCQGKEHLEEQLDIILKDGGEGVMMRLQDSFYENRRSKTLLKVKVFQDAEATVIAHEKGTGRLAYTMGAIRVKTKEGIEFKIGSGFTDQQRKNPPKIGSVVTYKFQELSRDGKPRFPVFLRMYEGV